MNKNDIKIMNSAIEILWVRHSGLAVVLERKLAKWIKDDE